MLDLRKLIRESDIDIHTRQTWRQLETERDCLRLDIEAYRDKLEKSKQKYITVDKKMDELFSQMAMDALGIKKGRVLHCDGDDYELESIDRLERPVVRKVLKSGAVSKNLTILPIWDWEKMEPHELGDIEL